MHWYYILSALKKHPAAAPHLLFIELRRKSDLLHSTCCKAVADRARPGHPHPPPPILSFEKWSLDPSGPLRWSNLILSECLYNFETNTLFIGLRFVFDIHGGREEGGEPRERALNLWLSQFYLLQLDWERHFVSPKFQDNPSTYNFHTPPAPASVNYSIFHWRYQCINQVISYSITGAGDYKWQSPLWGDLLAFSEHQPNSLQPRHRTCKGKSRSSTN